MRAANEEMMGFYSSGPKIKENDLKVGIVSDRVLVVTVITQHL